jgi:hypothetical protein
MLHHGGTPSTGMLNSSSVCDKRAKGHRRSSFVRTEDVIRAARKAIKRSATKSLWRLAQQIGAQPALHGESVVMTCRCFRTKCS